jgi:enoyl-CoA hydratase
MSAVSLTRHDDVWELRLTAPQRRNAIDRDLAVRLVELAGEVAASSARALVLTAEGDTFCSGADVVDLFGETRPIDQTRRVLQEVYRGFLSLRELPIPSVAAVQGPAIGAGFNLAMCCDIRILGPQARFSLPFTRIGLHPGGGSTWFLVRAIGRERALKVLLEGGEFTAEAAVAAGLASTIAPDPREAALAFAHTVAELDPHLVAAVRRSVDLAVEGSLAAVTEVEAWEQARSASSPALARHVERFRNRTR